MYLCCRPLDCFVLQQSRPHPWGKFPLNRGQGTGVGGGALTQPGLQLETARQPYAHVQKYHCSRLGQAGWARNRRRSRRRQTATIGRSRKNRERRRRCTIRWCTVRQVSGRTNKPAGSSGGVKAARVEAWDSRGSGEDEAICVSA